MEKRFRRGFTSLRERTCVSYAKIVTMGGYCDIDLIIIKATSPDDLPLSDKYVHEFLKIFSLSPTSLRAFALSFTRRFGKTRSWRVALKCLLLLHRLLRALPDDGSLRAEFLWARTNGFLSLYPCTFQDSSSLYSEDYTSFVRSYARLLDEALDCAWIETLEEQKMQAFLEVDDQENSRLETGYDFGKKLEILPQIQNIIDRAIDCWPVGAPSKAFLVHSAMKHVLRDSFLWYAAFRRDIMVVLENLIQLPYRSCVTAFGIYKKAAVQADRLSQFHLWSQNMGCCGYYEYPFIDRIPEIQVRALENFLNGMWQLTDQSSSSNTETTLSSQQSVSSNLTEDDDDGKKQVTGVEQERKNGAEMPPLIKWENGGSCEAGWEELLEASIVADASMATRNEWHLQECNNPCAVQITANPFLAQLHRENLGHGSCPNTPMHYPWGL